MPDDLVLKGSHDVMVRKKTIVLDVTLELHHSYRSFHFYESRASTQLAVGGVLTIVHSMHACMKLSQQKNRTEKKNSIVRQRSIGVVCCWMSFFLERIRSCFWLVGWAKGKKREYFLLFLSLVPFLPSFLPFRLDMTNEEKKKIPLAHFSLAINE